MSSIATPEVTFPNGKPDSPLCGPLFDSSVAWRARTGSWPVAFVTEIGTTAPDPRVDGVIAFLLDCGFELHRNPGIDGLESTLAGVRASRAPLVLICTRGHADLLHVRRLVIAMPDVDYILVAGERPSTESDREGDQGARFEYVDPVHLKDELVRTMQFVMRGLGIAPH